MSLDTLKRERFLQLTRRDGLKKLLRAIDAAVDAGYTPLKLNCVIMRGTNDDELRVRVRVRVRVMVRVRERVRVRVRVRG